jgi:hypothetical protein
MKTISTIVLVATALGAPLVRANEKVGVRVSPTVAFAPAFLRVLTTIEPSDDNRLLRIELDSPSYYRSSDIPLNGRNAQRVSVFEVKDVPTGLYEVRARLVGVSGPIATTVRVVKVAPSAGQDR